MGETFERGDKVQRCALKYGDDPAYRFRGTVCGGFVNPATGTPGSVVSLDHDPGCCQLFPNYMLERRATTNEGSE